jgi:signal transduction histidine kinase
MKVMLCDRGNVLADFQHEVRQADPSFEVDIETDPYRAVERAFASRPDVIVTEIDLHGVSGIELLRRFREAAPRARVICWSRIDSADTAIAMLGAGASGFLLKDDDRDEVIAAIRSGSGVVAVSRSVAGLISRREAQARLRELELEDQLAKGLGEIQQMHSAKGEFLANISHELRTPVTVAKGISQVLISHDVPDPERKEFLAKLDEALDKLMGIVDGILTIAEADRGNLALAVATVDLIPLIHSAAEEAGRKYPEVEIERVLPNELSIAADRARVGEVVRHLLDNACRYSPPGGTVLVRGRRLDEGAVVSVTDQGEGILREVVAKAFDEPFSTGESTLRKERSGAGLGLHMARRLVVEHGGVMWADPLPAGGTRVSFCLPSHVGQTLTAPPVMPADSGAAGERIA